MSFELYDKFYHKSLEIKQVDPYLIDKIHILDETNMALFYMLILHYKNTHRGNFDIRTKFPYGMIGTEKLIHGNFYRFPVELQKVIQAFLDEIF